METPELTTTPVTVQRCETCYKDVSPDDAFCQSCGYPLKGTDQEQKDFRLQHDFRNIDLFAFNSKIKKASNALYYLSGIFVVSGLIIYFINPNAENAVAVLITNLILAMLFLALGGYSKKKPLACIISGLCLYTIIVILNAIVDPITIVRGIIFKIVVIGFLINGLKSALEVEKIKKENNLS
ncbi:MAG: zinc ribbon domain-containing protein [Mucilaginibacter sp.]